MMTSLSNTTGAFVPAVRFYMYMVVCACIIDYFRCHFYLLFRRNVSPSRSFDFDTMRGCK